MQNDPRASMPCPKIGSPSLHLVVALNPCALELASEGRSKRVSYPGIFQIPPESISHDLPRVPPYAPLYFLISFSFPSAQQSR